MENRITNNTEVHKTPYDSVLFKSGVPLMEVEANEMQNIILYKLSQIHKIIGNCVVGFNQIRSEDGSYTVPDGTIAVCGGHIIDMSGIIFNIPGNVDAIYINIEDNVIYTPDSKITAYGAVSGDGSIIQNPTEIKNNILDDRIKKATTMRKGFKWWLSDTKDTAVKDSFAIFKVADGTLSVHDDMGVINNIVNRFESMEEEMADLGKSVSDGKSAVASAITSLGVSTSPDATFDDIVNNIGGIGDKYANDIKEELEKAGVNVDDGDSLSEAISKISDVTPTIENKNIANGVPTHYAAVASVGDNKATLYYDDHGGSEGEVSPANALHVLSNKYFASSSAGRNVKGEMPNHGAVTQSINPGSSIIIPAGYHNGNGKVTANNASGTAGAGDVLTGKTFSNGSGLGISGTMPNHGAVTQSLGIGGSYTIPAGYHNGNGKVTVNITNQGTKNASLNRGGTSSYTIPAGYHNGSGKVSCGCTDRGAWTGTINPGGSIIIPAGYHNGNGKVTANAATSGGQVVLAYCYNIDSINYATPYPPNDGSSDWTYLPDLNPSTSTNMWASIEVEIPKNMDYRKIVVALYEQYGYGIKSLVLSSHKYDMYAGSGELRNSGTKQFTSGNFLVEVPYDNVGSYQSYYIKLQVSSTTNETVKICFVALF